MNRIYAIDEDSLRRLDLISFRDGEALISMGHREAWLIEIPPGPDNPFTPIREQYDYYKAVSLKVTKEQRDLMESISNVVILSNTDRYHIVNGIVYILIDIDL